LKAFSLFLHCTLECHELNVISENCIWLENLGFRLNSFFVSFYGVLKDHRLTFCFSFFAHFFRKISNFIKGDRHIKIGLLLLCIFNFDVILLVIL
jgi:uncharacterized protein (DUF1919 family)